MLYARLIIAAFFIFTFPIAHADPIFRINNGANQVIDKHDICRHITNASGKDIMVPTGTKVEWESFVNSTNLTGVTVTNIHASCIRASDSFETPASGLPTGWTSGFHTGFDGQLSVSTKWSTDGTQSALWDCPGSGGTGDMKKSFDLTDIGTLKIDAYVEASGRGSSVTVLISINGTDETISSTGEITFDVSALSGNHDIFVYVQTSGSSCSGAVDNLRLYSK